MGLGTAFQVLRLRTTLPLPFRRGCLPILPARLDGRAVPGRAPLGGARQAARARASPLVSPVEPQARPPRSWRTTVPRALRLADRSG